MSLEGGGRKDPILFYFVPTGKGMVSFAQQYENNGLGQQQNLISTSTATWTSSPSAERMDVAFFHLNNNIEKAQIYTNTFWEALKLKIALLFEKTSDFVGHPDINGKVIILWDRSGEKFQDFLDILRSHGFHFQITSYAKSMSHFIKSEISRQAILFGCTGLVFGLIIGYNFSRSSAFSSRSISCNGSTSLSLTPATMRGIISTSFNKGIDSIALTSSLPFPKITEPDQIIVQVRAVSLDNIDIKMAEAYPNSKNNYFRVLGREVSGIVKQTGPKVFSFAVNDQIWACMDTFSAKGVMSEFIVIKEKFASHKPRNISFEGASTLPYSALVVWNKILLESKLDSQTTKNKRILIHLGFSSKNDGVGLLAIQVLKSYGGRITISTQENDIDDFQTSSGVSQMTFLHTLKSLGAESHLTIPTDFTSTSDLTQRIFDVVINTDCAKMTPLLREFCKDPESSVIETFPKINFNNLLVSNFSTTNGLFSSLMHTLGYPLKIFIHRDREKSTELTSNLQFILEECKRLVENGKVYPVVSKTFSVDHYDQAFRHVSNAANSNSTSAHVGKSVIVFK